ncbi:unnamed protein product [Brugia timori]|uniref:Uncharacterized protein n=1 Tax=Brugia timori TaxID=42155 RepID=A0A0R3QYP3_9BILA|nr:unnamed protein product [Brugia timori]
MANLQFLEKLLLQIEQCCEVLASDERRRSLSKDNSATIIAELASVMSELNNVHQLLEAHKVFAFFVVVDLIFKM